MPKKAAKPSGRVQLSSGWAKGMILEVPADGGTRPTAAKVRQAVLNMLQPELEGARVLELFAGSGAIGFEMLSRGASACTFVDSSAAAIASIKRSALELESRAHKQKLPMPTLVVARSSAKDALARVVGGVDIVWADPPYADVREAAIWLLGSGGALSVGAQLLIIEGPAEENLSDIGPLGQNSWNLEKDRIYGATRISLWRR